jgi:energy-coupling factor transport system ATP-binding protein
VSVLVLEEVTYRYPGAPAPALDRCSLAVEPGELVLVAGASGSGKSTLLRAAAGLVPHFHGGTFGGRLIAGGLDTREHGPGALAEVTGTLFQDPETQVVLGTVRAEVAFGLENRGWPAAAVARGVEEAALALGLSGLLDRRTHELSAGELQRVALAAAIAGRPRLLALDEPTSQLDPVAGDELLGVLRRLNEEWGTAILLAEHRVERCLPAADRVVELAGGRVVADVAPRAWLRRSHATPLARLWSLAGLGDPPVTVKEARALLAGELGEACAVPAGTVGEPGAQAGGPAGEPPTHARRLRRPRHAPPPALDLRGVWVELRNGPAVLRGVDLRAHDGDAIALMGRNGAGKTTLLRTIAGLVAPTRGKVLTAEVALLTQHPGDHLLTADAGGRHPRDLSGGERQRAALELVLRAGARIVLLDEPTRGMDAVRKQALADRLRDHPGVVVVATHDAEFAAAFATRVVLLGDGRPVADAAPAELLAGGWYFSTQVARALAGAGGALTPEDGAALLRARVAEATLA